MRRYTVLLYPDPDGGYSVLVPAFGLLTTQGETVEEALAMAQDVIQVATRGLIEDGEDVPEEETPPLVTTVDVPVLVAARA